MAYTFTIATYNEYSFIIADNTYLTSYWIFKNGYWDDDGIWVDTEEWKDE